MISDIFYRLLEKRHFWRYASFSEIAELYISRTMRVIAMNIISGFTSVFLYEEGYSLAFIFGFWLCYYLLKMFLTLTAGNLVARIGPKHGILISNFLYAPSMLALGFMPQMGVVSILLWGLFMAASTSIYHISYMVDFSKVKNVKHAGKEIALMNILEKIAIGVSPIIGGVIALWFGLQVVIWVAAALFAFSVVPLLKTVEPVKVNQSIDLRGYPWRETLQSILAHTGVGFDYVTTGIVWSLFIVVAVFPGAGWDVYVKLGILSSVTILTALFASYAYGKLIDRRKGGNLLKYSVIANSLVHVFRPFAVTPISIVGINIANEAATMGYSMSFMRGVFDTADISGYRIAYICLADTVANFGAAIACLILLVCNIVMGEIDCFRIFFVCSAISVLIIGMANFRLYRQ